MPSTARFLREFLRPREGAVVVEETAYRRGDESLPATLYRPRSMRVPLPGWTTLHGLTYYGREHLSLIRLARSLAAAGSVVLVPDIPEWRALRVAPATTVRTIQAAVLALDGLGFTVPGRIGVIGFSFGATQALVAATDPSLRGHLAGIASWGGYADIAATARWAFLGEHELDGRIYRGDPDPYGRWVLAGNYLSALEELGTGPEPGMVYLDLAHAAARARVMAWDPALDPLKEQARRRLPPEHQAVFDLIAPPADSVLTPAQRLRLRSLIDRMMPAAVARDPLLDPGRLLGRVPVPVFLAHGYGDRLIPWTEMVRLQRALPPERVVSSATTRLFAHSAGERRRISPAAAVHAVRFVRLMGRMLRLI
jgi:hypothetical protein